MPAVSMHSIAAALIALAHLPWIQSRRMHSGHRHGSVPEMSVDLTRDFIKKKRVMKPGQNFSVGFEFECANKIYGIRGTMLTSQFSCPDVAYPFDAHRTLKGYAEMDMAFPYSEVPPYDLMEMPNFPAMPSSVRSIVWTKDAYMKDHGKDCSRGHSRGKPWSNGKCLCNYTLEFKTLPLSTESEIRDSLIGAGLTLREASKKERGFQGWNVDKLFEMRPDPNKCTGATHVTKAYIIKRESLVDMLKQQMLGYCVRHQRKETSGARVFRTSFIEAYMLWRIMSYCQTFEDEECILQDTCKDIWSTPEKALKDIEATLLLSEEERQDIFGEARRQIAWQKNVSEESLDYATMPCSPARALPRACFSGDGGVSYVERRVFADPEWGFSLGAEKDEGFYYGPGGGKVSDTTTKVGAMLSSDGRTLYGLAEHRKDAWSNVDLRKCLYYDMVRAESQESGEAILAKSKHCALFLQQALTVDYEH